jgi:hypothetical protein
MPVSDTLDPVFQAAGNEWNVDPLLLKAIASPESGGNAGAVSPKGAQGLMQIMPQTQRGLGVTDPNDPAQSIWGAAKYMSQALDAEKTPEDALRFYHGGPGWRDAYGPESQAYVPLVAAAYQRLTNPGGKTGATAVAQAKRAPNADATDDFLSGKTAGAPASAPAQAAQPDATDDFLSGKGTAGAPATAATTGQPGGGVGRNIAAGITDAVGNVANVASDPVGNLLGKPLATGLVFAHDLIAPMVGGQRFPDDVRNILLGDNMPQAGTRAVNAAANVVGFNPESVPANNLLERYARLGTGGALTMATGGAPGMVAGFSGGIAGNVAGSLVPSWAQPAAELAGGVVGGAVGIPLAGGVRAGAVAGADATKAGVNLLAAGPGALSRWADAAPQNALRPRDFGAPQEATAPQTSAVAAPTPQQGSAAPSAAGAAASTPAEAAMTPEQVAAYRSTAEGRKLLETQQPGVRDTNVYIHGVDPNEAEIEQTVNAARELKSLGITAPDVSQDARETADLHNDKRQQFFAGLAKSDVDVANAEANLATQDQRDLRAAWQNKTAADAQPVVDRALEIKASSDGRRPAVREAVDDVTKELYDNNGDMITDPEQLYGVRKHIDDMLSEEGIARRPLTVRVKAHLLDLKSTLDGQIIAAAPPFAQYLENTTASRRLIDTMKVLQNHENKLFDSQNRMTYNKVQTMMRQIVDSRANADPLSPYKSIPADTMGQLWNLRDDLRRSASAQELARTPGGSDTVQNAWDAAKGVMGGIAGDTALHVGANAAFGAAGSPVVAVLKSAGNALLAGRTARRQTARGLEMLHPDPVKYPLRNPLQPD